MVLLIDEKSVADADIQAKTMSLINRVSKMHATCQIVQIIYIPYLVQTLANFSDMDSFYEVVDDLEEKGMEKIMSVSINYSFIPIILRNYFSL